jgi:hypothetical protein
MVPLLFLLPIFGRDNLLLLGRTLSSSLAAALESGDVRGDVSSFCIEYAEASTMDGTPVDAEVMMILF